MSRSCRRLSLLTNSAFVFRSAKRIRLNPATLAASSDDIDAALRDQAIRRREPWVHFDIFRLPFRSSLLEPNVAEAPELEVAKESQTKFGRLRNPCGYVTSAIPTPAESGASRA